MTVRDLMKQLIELNPEAEVIVELQSNNGSMCKELSSIQLKTKWTDETPVFKTPYLQVDLARKEMEEI